MNKATILILVIAASCSNFRDPPATVGTVASVPVPLDSSVLATLPLASKRSVHAFYASRAFLPFWSRSGAIRADSLLRVIRNADRLGLLPQDYHLEEVETLLSDSLSLRGLSELDVLLTDSYLSLHQHLRQGRLNPRTFQRADPSAAPDTLAIASLKRTDPGSVSAELGSVEPKSRQYQALKKALERMSSLPEADPDRAMQALKVALNMERWRWEKQWPSRYIYVNVPAFLLTVTEEDSIWLESKVIVGKRATPTPVLDAVIRSFTIYPYWHVPYSIATKEILPALKRDVSYLRRNNFEVLNKTGSVISPDTIQWQIYNEHHFPFILRQREGSENSMGVIKFNFANPYGVYLHDTNSKGLFRYSRRDLSHGCVRVQRAAELARYLVREDDVYVSPEDLDQYLSLQQRLLVGLRKPISLKVRYFTCEVVNHSAVFYEDVYKQDSLMIQALYYSSSIAPR